jgi:hypothetical protein
MTQEQVTGTLLSIAEKFGVPCVILAAFIWMAREAAVSVHDTVVVPIVESHTEFLDKMCQTQEQQAETLKELADGQREIRTVLITSGSKNFQCSDDKQ